SNAPLQITRRVMDTLCAYDWPGNVRELENAIERAATLCDHAVLQVGDLPPSLLAAAKINQPYLDTSDTTLTLPSAPDSALYPLHVEAKSNPTVQTSSSKTAPQPLGSLKSFLHEQERAYLNKALDECGGDKERAALLLGVSLATFYRKL